MEVNIQQIKKDLNDFKKLIDEYEDNFLNMYKELENATLYWKDNYSKIIFKDIREKKQKIKTNIEELNDLKGVYQYILESYSKLGEKIIANTNNKGKVISKFDDYINKIDNIIALYNHLDLKSFSNELQIILLQKEKLVKNKKIVIQLKQNMQQILSDIEEYEKEVSLKVFKINIEIIQDTIQKNLQINTKDAIMDLYYMDTSQIEVFLNKIKMYKKEEDINFERIIEKIIDMNTYYKTKNTSSLNNIEFDIDRKLKSINQIHENYITIITNKISDYQETSKKILESFEDVR